MTFYFKTGLFFIFFIILGVFLVSAVDYSVKIDYDFYNDSSVRQTLEYSSVLLKVSTDRDAYCRYDESDDVDFEDMDGRFDLSSGDLHEKSFSELGDGGIYKYYIKCVEDPDNYSTEPKELEVILRINDRVSAQIMLSEDDPLKGGIVEVTLLTSKLVSKTPILSYSFDGSTYENLPLIGSEKKWEGQLHIPKNLDEAVLSFEFKANDLEGREGTEITSGGIYVIDTVAPKVITDFEAIGYEGKIELEWHQEEDVDKFKVYRSTSPGVDYTNYYSTTTEDSYIDVGVDKGKTYYYRVTSVDEADNEAGLSVEKSATALFEDGEEDSSNNGLSVELRGKVDNLISEIESVISDVTSIRDSISQKNDDEMEIFEDLDLEKEIVDSKGELESLKKEVGNFKLQDITKDELDRKLDSSRLKLNIIKKKVPENIVIIGEDSRLEEISEEDIQESILELKPSILDKERTRSLDESIKTIGESSLEIQSYYYIIEIVYLDGTKNQISIIKREINSDLENNENNNKISFIETIPKDLAESSSELNILNLDYEVVKDDPVLSFNSDTKEIIYTISKRSTFNVMKDAKISLVYLYEEGIDVNPGITGYFSFVDSGGGSIWFILGLILVVSLVVYFFYLKKKKPSEMFIKCSKRLDEAAEEITKKNLNKAEEIYSSLNGYYKDLKKNEKAKIFKEIDMLRNKILSLKLEEGLEELQNSKDKTSFEDLEKIYNSLSDKFKKKISKSFNKIKEDIKNEN